MNIMDCFLELEEIPNMQDILRKKEKEQGLFPMPKSFESICKYYNEELTEQCDIQEAMKRQQLVNDLCRDPYTQQEAYNQRNITTVESYNLVRKYTNYLIEYFNLDYKEIARQSIKEMPNCLEDQSLMAGAYINACNDIYGSGLEARTHYVKRMFEDYCYAVAERYVTCSYLIRNPLGEGIEVTMPPVSGKEWIELFDRTAK